MIYPVILGSAIVAELNQVPGQYARSMLLYTILASVDKTAHDEPGENIRSDKDAVGALEELYKMTIETGSYGHDDEGGVGFLPYIGRLIQCDADPVCMGGGAGVVRTGEIRRFSSESAF